jgi:N-sulfoglucosamine sulfohydrolase
MRAIRTREFLYVQNLRPDRWPAGDPDPYRDPKRPFGDCDDGPTKRFILDHREEPGIQKVFDLCFAKRPAEELYDLRKDPDEINNVAGQAKYAKAQKQLRARLDQWMKATADPRAVKDDDHWDSYPYFGGAANAKQKSAGK